MNAVLPSHQGTNNNPRKVEDYEDEEEDWVSNR